jgi:hypothetical protein
MSGEQAIYQFPDGDMQEGLKRQRERLLAAAVTYVRDGRDGAPQDRLRTASSLSGIPINLIEVELKK